MKIVVAGPRTFKYHQFVYQVLDAVIQKSDIILQGGASGVDAITKTWARTHGRACRTFPAQWDQDRNAAGPKRNAEMAVEADALIAFWDGNSAGTGNMIKQMQALKKPIMYVRLDDTKEEERLSALYQFYGAEDVPQFYTKHGKDLF